MPQSIIPPQLLKAIYLIKNEQKAKASSRNVASKLGISSTLVRKMVESLKRKGLVKILPYKGYHLSPKGEILALRQIRRHRIWETFLFRQLGMDLMAIHQEALRLELHASDEMILRMDEQLGFPMFDPHGDPIPSADGTMPDISTFIPISQFTVGTTGRIARLTYQTESFSQFCDKNALNIGNEITVISKESTGGINLRYMNEEIYATAGSASQIYLYSIE